MSEPGEEPRYKTQLREETEALANTDILSPAYRRKKILIWFIRNLITALICWYYWEKWWVKWLLWIGVPLAIISLLMILVGPYLLRRKIKTFREKIDSVGKE